MSRTQRPRAFKFRAVRTKSGAIQWQGEKRTFLIPTGKNAGIYQRKGRRGRGGSVTLLYTFATSVPIDPLLNFIDNAKRVISRRFGQNFRKAWALALRTAR